MGLAFLTIGCSFAAFSLAWFCPPQTNKEIQGLTGEATGSYFEGGTGTESDPYLIANAKQLYYFSWLQDMGYFNDSSSGTIAPTYFELMNDIDASGFVLPPCGIETYPFVSNFDAKNYTVKNLTVSNYIGDNYITNYPTSRITPDAFNSNAAIVGFFGIIGSYNGSPASYDTEATEVKNLYLDNLTIKTKKDNLLVGIFAGYVNGEINNCGVHYAKMDINGATSKISDFSKVSEFTLIGSYNKKKYKWDGDPDSGSGSGGDVGYGTSVDIRKLHGTLEDVGLVDSSSGDGKLAEGVAIPFKSASGATLSSPASSTITLGGKSVTNAQTLATSSTEKNIGFYVGGTVSSTYDSVSTARVMKDHYSSTEVKVDYDNIKVSGNADSTITEVPERVKTYLSKTVDGTIKQGDSVIKLTTPNLLNETMGKDSGFYGIEKTKVQDYEGNVLVPNNCIWVAPKKAGTFEFVCVNENTTLAIIAIWKLHRSVPKDYSSSLSTPGSNDRTNFNDYSDASYVGMQVPYYSSWSSSTYSAYYYGTTISQSEIDNDGVEFGITLYGNPTFKRPVYITYMDIGTDGGGDSGSSEDTRLALADFDFVTKDSSGALTKIKNIKEDGTLEDNASYTKSQVFFEISDLTGEETLFAFRRLEDTIGVLYYQSASGYLVSGGSGKPKAGSDENCDTAAS